MPKITKYPRLRTKIYKGPNGQAYVYYTYDMRPEGKPDIRLGKDYDSAIAQWDELHNRRPQTIGRLEEAFTRWQEQELDKYDSPETRKGYAKNLRTIRPVFGQMAWDEVTLPALRQYLDLRSAKTQGNREMALLRIIWGKALLWGMTRLPWPAAGIRGWKNKEGSRVFEVTDELFDAVYQQADQVLRDCMDIASATGLRITDVRTLRLPQDGSTITHRANKTGKSVRYTVAQSAVLTAIVERRNTITAYSPMLLCTRTGRAVSMRMLRERWEEARDKAALQAMQEDKEDLSRAIRAMFLRDMRSRAADLAQDIDEASRLLQHSSKSVTERHYRTRAEDIKPVR